MASEKSPGQVMAAMLADSLAAYQMGPIVGDHERQIIWGVTPDGSFVDEMTLDGFVARANRSLMDSGRVYRFGNTVVYETCGPGDRHLAVLAMQHRAEPNASPILANLLGVGVQTKQGVVQSLASPKLIGAVLADESLWGRLPEIKYHARRLTFDGDFDLCKSGFNAGSGILVHAPEIVPAVPAPVIAPGAGPIDRLPTRLRGLLGEFSWRSCADAVNALAMIMTGVLINHFIDDPHPGGIVDGNQPGIGKTLLVQCIGRVLDDAEPPRISIVRDEELEKKLCAQLRSSRTSLVFLDNVKSRIESAVIEQNMLSATLNFRVLGRSSTIERPNAFLWMITSNLTAGTPDVIRRCVPIRLFYEGDPRYRSFSGDPLGYAVGHRLEILGEIAGMVVRWVQRGKPLGQHKHRCKKWASLIGGILDANGLGETFLANVAESEAQMDQGLVDLATLAEHAVARGLADLHVPAGGNPCDKGRASSQWVSAFAETQVLRDRFAEAAPKGKATAVGMFFSGKVDHPVPIETADGPRMATLRRREAGSGQKLYYFEIATAEADGGADQGPTTAGAEAPATLGVQGLAQGHAAAEGGPGLANPQTPWMDAAPAVINHPSATGGLEWI